MQTPNALVSQSEGDHVVTAPGSDALFTTKRSWKWHLGTGVCSSVWKQFLRELHFWLKLGQLPPFLPFSTISVLFKMSILSPTIWLVMASLR